ncbi:MAG TPA: adenylyltransferase/cytidyltransferase family protein [Candidatus Omnitrophota bacterium]|nr:adenylyltransferase/cytidyltransferase family protein [Candidatus Omnitrophota bacterium]
MNSNKKIVSLASLKRKLSALRKQKRTIAFTNGCFDILHYGHVSYLQKARAKDRVLVVGLNSDSSVRKIKGPQRPVNSELNRAGVLAGLECVDFVTIFNEETPYELIRAVRPDILIKGADWKGKAVAGSDLVSRVELIEYVPNLSTTSIIGKIKKSGQAS